MAEYYYRLAMSLDADVAAVVDGSRPKVRGILRLPTRPPPSYSAVAARQTEAIVPFTPTTPQPTLPPQLPVSVHTPQSWQTVVVARRRGEQYDVRAGPPMLDDSVAGVAAEVTTEESKAEARRRKKKKAGEPPPHTLQFAELLEAQLKRVEETRAKATDTAADTSEFVQQHAASLTSSPPTTSTATADSTSATSPNSGGKRAKPTRLKRQMREQQLTAFIRHHILAPIVQAVVAQHEGSVGEGGGAGEESEESERREREKREKTRMLRHLKRKQKRIDKHANTNQSTSSISQPQSPSAASHTPRTAMQDSDAVREQEEKEREWEEEKDDADDGAAAAAVESLVPHSQPVNAEEDPSCPTQPYSFTEEERAFLFQHVVVDRYHSQPPLSPTVSALCQQLFTASLDSPVAHLLLALASYQRRALSSSSPLVRARGRRLVMGLREAAKRLKQNKLHLLILPHNVETTHPTLTSQLVSLYFQCVARRVEVVWALSRRRLASCCGVKGKVAVVGVVSGEGCSELMRAVKERAKEAREAWVLRGWDERVEAGVRDRREREEADRVTARREWQERELEARREEQKQEKARLEQQIEQSHKRDELHRIKQATQRVEQQRLAALKREMDERKEIERIADETEKVKRKQRQERTKGQQQQQQHQQSSKDEGKDEWEVGRGGGGKRTWLEEAVEGEEGRLDVKGGGKQGKVKGQAMTGKPKNRR